MCIKNALIRILFGAFTLFGNWPTSGSGPFFSARFGELNFRCYLKTMTRNIMLTFYTKIGCIWVRCALWTIYRIYLIAIHSVTLLPKQKNNVYLDTRIRHQYINYVLLVCYWLYKNGYVLFIRQSRNYQRKVAICHVCVRFFFWCCV